MIMDRQRKTRTAKILMLFIFVLLFSLISGCSGKVYEGKYISTKVPYDPIDEFKYEGWVILAFQTPGKRPEEGKLFEFWLFRNGEKRREMWLSAKIVNKRMFFLQERIGENIISHASFSAPPTYEAIKERLKALLSSESKNN